MAFVYSYNSACDSANRVTSRLHVLLRWIYLWSAVRIHPLQEYRYHSGDSYLLWHLHLNRLLTNKRPTWIQCHTTHSWSNSAPQEFSSNQLGICRRLFNVIDVNDSLWMWLIWNSLPAAFRKERSFHHHHRRRYRSSSSSSHAPRNPFYFPSCHCSCCRLMARVLLHAFTWYVCSLICFNSISAASSLLLKIKWMCYTCAYVYSAHTFAICVVVVVANVFYSSYYCHFAFFLHFYFIFILPNDVGTRWNTEHFNTWWCGRYTNRKYLLSSLHHWSYYWENEGWMLLGVRSGVLIVCYISRWVILQHFSWLCFISIQSNANWYSFLLRWSMIEFVRCMFVSSAPAIFH